MEIEKKKALVIYGSPNDDGHTRGLLNSFTGALENYIFEEVNAFSLNARPCIDCGYCKNTEGCVYNDLDELDRLLRESDLLIVATPIYNFSFPAPLKAVLDRTQRYFSARFSLGIKPSIEKHRKAILLMTMGSNDFHGRDFTLYQLERAFTVLNTELYGHVLWSETDREENNKSNAIDKAHDMALEIMNNT